MNWKCKLFGHKWAFGKNVVFCNRKHCNDWLVRQMTKYDGPPFIENDNTIIIYKHGWRTSIGVEFPVNFRKHTIVPITTVQVAEAACREAKYYQTAKALRKCLTAEK